MLATEDYIDALKWAESIGGLSALHARANSNMKVMASVASPPGFLGVTNSDLAFTGKYAIQGNYNGPVIWDMSNPSNPVLVTAYSCPASQNDISVYKNLMFMSAEANNGRVDCKFHRSQAR